MFEGLTTFFKRVLKPGQALDESSKDTAKERLHLVLMQDRANVSADFLDLMKQEIIDVIKKYVEVDEKEIDVRLTNQSNEDGTNGAPALYANIPIVNIKNDVKAEKMNKKNEEEAKVEEKVEEKPPVKRGRKKKKVEKPEEPVVAEVTETVKVTEEVEEPKVTKAVDEDIVQDDAIEDDIAEDVTDEDVIDVEDTESLDIEEDEDSDK